MKRSLHLLFLAGLTLLIFSSRSAHAGIVTFGSDANSFNMEFVTIGNAGNTADITGAPNPAGAVAYEYKMGKYEVSRGMIDAYNAIYGTPNSLAITMQTTYGSFTPERAASGISWNEAARFVNWLNTSQGYSAAYKFTTSGVNDNIALWSVGDEGYDASNPYRNSNAVYVLPTVDEWYKAAYYDPNTGTWRQYASLDGNLPTAVASGTADNTAVYDQSSSAGPADITQAGGLNAYGIMGMNGNVYELEETSYDLNNSAGSSPRSNRGGNWSNNSLNLSSSNRSDNNPVSESFIYGFRVASLSSPAAVPEPGSLAVWSAMCVGGLCYRRRRARK
ncbi:SUMF1/EgtB/PvdO family nonheme iron enzyme [Rubripirellula sp.]|nr:SUMF1/EgtB/PvdO family nonheme iron enzyme [Rubripirellula sp.]MDB4338989.1 SUMF1/EgtB/PvdO family nonheme iron enzyme [Rubripirellula sp.]